MGFKTFIKSLNEEEEQVKEVRKAYNLLFTSVHGQKVLAHMLAELNFFGEVATEEDRILHNYAKRLLNNIGVIQGPNVPDIVRALLTIPFERKEE